MRFRLFQYALPADPDLADLNAFIAGSRVATVSQHVVAQAGGALLVFVVETVGKAAKDAASVPAAGTKIDYRDALSAEDFALFSRLRRERQRIAEAEGVPVYAVFSNAQLAEMVTRRVTTAAELGGIDGVGKARIDKYAARFVTIISAEMTATDDVPEGPQ